MSIISSLEALKKSPWRYFSKFLRVNSTARSLYVFLHECAHAHLGHSYNSKLPRHVEEMQAEQWAHEKMREHGVPVPRSQTKRAKAYVRRKIHSAISRGGQTY
jgi:hypothetical protein